MHRIVLATAAAAASLLSASLFAVPQKPAPGAGAQAETAPPSKAKPTVKESAAAQEKPAVSDDAAVKAKPTPLDRFKAMAGSWDADIDQDGTNDTVVTYRVIANGSTVMETLFAGESHEMVTMYYLDGETLTLTHFCAIGNQPRLTGRLVGENAIAFEFKDGTNMKSRDDMHMDAVTFTFAGPDKVSSSWSGYADGKSDHGVTFDMTRRKE